MKTLLIVCVAVVLAGCSGARQLYSLPETPSQYAKAVLVHHNAIGNQVAVLRDNPDVSEGSKEDLRLLYRDTVCSADERALDTQTADCRNGPVWRLESSAQAYDAVQSAATEAELESALRSAIAAIDAIISAL